MNEIGYINVYINTYFQYQIPSNIFLDEDGDSLTYSLSSFNAENSIPTWLMFIASNQTLNGFPTAGQGTTLMLKVYVNDGRGGVSYQVIYLVINPNYDIRLVPLVFLGLLPLVGIFGFAFAMAFVKVPELQNEAILHSKNKVDYDLLKMALEEQVRYKHMQNLIK